MRFLFDLIEIDCVLDKGEVPLKMRLPSSLNEIIVNGTYACENDKMLNGVLKGELGFPGCEPSAFRPEPK